MAGNLGSRGAHYSAKSSQSSKAEQALSWSVEYAAMAYGQSEQGRTSHRFRFEAKALIL
jgi:hypothetical protein